MALAKRKDERITEVVGFEWDRVLCSSWRLALPTKRDRSACSAGGHMGNRLGTWTSSQLAVGSSS